MVTGDDQLAYIAFADFARAARVFASGGAEAVLHWLFPPSLRTEREVHDRVHVMVAVGALVAGTVISKDAGTDSDLRWLGEARVPALAGQFARAGAELDARRTDVAVELVSACASEWGGRNR